jgi:hypothetical protein
MIKGYFSAFSKKSSKKTSPSKATATKGAKKTAVKIDRKALTGIIRGIIPSDLNVDSLKPIDGSGFSPEGADFIIYREYCRDIAKLIGGYIPYELIHGALFLVDDLSKNTLADALNRIVTVKKLNKFSEAENYFIVPSFILADCRKPYPLIDLKNDVINYYMSRSIEGELELELLAVLNYGIIIKDWHKGNGSFVALETGADTLAWFTVLMNEYLDVKREDEFDLRKYMRSEKVYNEF